MNDQFKLAINEGTQMAEGYLEVMEKSVQKRIEQLSHSPDFHQAIAQKFTQVFEHDTKEVMNDYANKCYERFKYLDPDTARDSSKTSKIG